MVYASLLIVEKINYLKKNINFVFMIYDTKYQFLYLTQFDFWKTTHKKK